ncbi:MAG: hypothetical protein ABS81_25945 [Pseudonocardia sp. SCN 72-86]|nr:MAG: hypothetical protein ABS81_25945 [Pseudonocardia sp. SCN 72-86]
MRPAGDAVPATTAAAFAGWTWPTAHLAGVAGFALVTAGLFGMRDRLTGTPGRRLAGWALGTWGAGAALVLPYYGAEAFSLHALGANVTDTATLVALTEAVRMGPIQVTVFGVGLVLLAVGGILAAVAAARSGVLPRWSGLVFALGFALYLPQFWFPMELRIAHGGLVAVGCIGLAEALRRAGPAR